MDHSRSLRRARNRMVSSGVSAGETGSTGDKDSVEPESVDDNMDGMVLRS